MKFRSLKGYQDHALLCVCIQDVLIIDSVKPVSYERKMPTKTVDTNQLKFT